MNPIQRIRKIQSRYGLDRCQSKPFDILGNGQLVEVLCSVSVTSLIFQYSDDAEIVQLHPGHFCCGLLVLQMWPASRSLVPGPWSLGPDDDDDDEKARL